MSAGEDGIVVTGASHVVLGGRHGEPSCDPIPYLRVRKSRKFMGIQDDLAVVAAGRALARAGLPHQPKGPGLGERAGLYVSVGYIPFDESEVERVLAGSIGDDGEFSMARFSSDGMQRAHPLLTFRCLPNMPAYHVSVNYDVQGPYVVTYPGVAQFYLALEEARAAIEHDAIDVALICGVAHQRNFLVTHHFQRIDEPVAPALLCDVGGCLVIERETHARARGARIDARLIELDVQYAPRPLEAPHPHREDFDVPSRRDVHRFGSLGPASLAIALASEVELAGVVRHRLEARDGVRATSTWELLP